MRFYYAALVAMATLLASANAAPNGAEQKQISQTTPDLAGQSLTETHSEKRFLRVHNPTYEEVPLDSLDSLDSLDGTEKRGGAPGYFAKALANLAKSKNENLPNILAKLSNKQLKQVAHAWNKQNIDLEAVAKKLRMSGVNDVKYKNYPVLKRFETLINKPRTS